MYVMSCISVKKDVQQEDAEKFLKNPEEEQPKIVIFYSNGENEVTGIIGDGIVLKLSETSLEYALIVLVSCYNVYDLAYPRKYCQFLGSYSILYSRISIWIPSQGFP